jgi:hypothetical protein
LSIEGQLGGFRHITGLFGLLYRKNLIFGFKLIKAGYLLGFNYFKGDIILRFIDKQALEVFVFSKIPKFNWFYF